MDLSVLHNLSSELATLPRDVRNLYARIQSVDPQNGVAELRALLGFIRAFDLPSSREPLGLLAIAKQFGVSPEECSNVIAASAREFPFEPTEIIDGLMWVSSVAYARGDSLEKAVATLGLMTEDMPMMEAAKNFRYAFFNPLSSIARRQNEYMRRADEIKHKITRTNTIQEFLKIRRGTFAWQSFAIRVEWRILWDEFKPSWFYGN